MSSGKSNKDFNVETYKSTGRHGWALCPAYKRYVKLGGKMTPMEWNEKQVLKKWGKQFSKHEGTMKFKEFLKGQSRVDEIFSKVPIDTNISGPARDLEALRVAVMAEYDAINLYEQLAQQVSNQKIKRTLLDISQEEKVHVGEFEQLLREFDKEHEESETEGAEEVEEI